MTSLNFVLSNQSVRNNVIKEVMEAVDNSRVEIKPPQRSLNQNAKMWAMLGDIANQVNWYNVKYNQDDWKLILLHGLNQELRMAPSIDGKSLVPLGRSTSKMSKADMINLIELIYYFGSQQDVCWSDKILTEIRS